MFEGKHIHFSPTDNKPLCSYSGKLCRQRRLNGYAFCIRHILEDKSAPFKQCSYVTRNNSQKCLNAIPSNQDRGYCHSHMQVVGIIPKTERKTKSIPSVSRTDSSSNISSNGSEKSSSPTIKKDPGAVFKFEEDSSDATDVFSYKNGLANGINGKTKGLKSKDSNSSNSSKDAKTFKFQNGFNGTTANFTTKKVTDKNRNVYTAIIPTGKPVNTNINSAKNVSQKNKIGSWNGSSSDDSSATQKRSSSSVVHLGSGIRAQKHDNIRKGGRELKKLHNKEEIRHFENLKTLKQLDRTIVEGSSTSSDDESSCDAKFKIFPRLAATALPKEFITTIIPENVVSSDVPLKNSSPKNNTLSSQTYSGSRCKSEIVRTPPVPPLITRSNNGIIIKTEPHVEVATEEDDGVKLGDIENSSFSDKFSEYTVEKQYRGHSSPSNANDDNNDHCNSIDRDLNPRHEFLAHVRNSFRSQYTSIKKACTVNEKYEQDRKQKLRNSLIRCVRIDSSICAQVLVGNGSKFSMPVKMELVTEASQDSQGRNADNGSEYDDYEFFDSDVLSSSSVTKACTAIVDHATTTRKCYSNGKKNSTGDKKIKQEDTKKKAEKTKSTPKRCSSAGKKGQVPSSVYILPNSPENENRNAQIDTTVSAAVPKQYSKRTDKTRASSNVTVDLKPALRTPPTKRRLKRADAMLGNDDTSPTISLMDTMKAKIKTEISSSEGMEKRRRFCSSEMAGTTDLGLTLHSQQSPSLAANFDLGDQTKSPAAMEPGLGGKSDKGDGRRHDLVHYPALNNANNHLNDVHSHHELNDMMNHPSSVAVHRNQGLETVLNSVGSSENAGTPDGVITDASFDSTFEHSTSSQPDCEFSEDDLEHSFELQIDPEIESQASRLLEDNVLTEADFTELFPDNRMSDHKFGRNDLQELGMAALDFDVNDIDYSLFANIFPNFPRTSQPESISISNPF